MSLVLCCAPDQLAADVKLRVLNASEQLSEPTKRNILGGMADFGVG